MKTAWVRAAALSLGFSCSDAMAHAFLDHASPRVGSSSAQAPAEVRLWFSEKVEPAFSTLRVVNAQGKQVDRKDKQVDASDARSMRVSLPPLTKGTYRVYWRVLSVDTHVTEGDYSFEVGN